MTSPTSESPPRGELDGPDKSSSLGGGDNQIVPDRAPGRKRIDRAKLALCRDALHEALGFVKLYADAAQALAEAGDDGPLVLMVGRVRDATVLACRAGRDIRELHAEAGR
jgi:hypothetical protein